MGKTANEAVLKVHPATALFTYISPHAVSVKVEVVGSGDGMGGGSVEGILILRGPNAGTLVVTGNGTLGLGTIHAGVGEATTAYYYWGDINNLSPESFEGYSSTALLGAKVLGSVGFGGSIAMDKKGGIVTGVTVSLGLGGSATVVSGDLGVEI